MTIAKKWHDCLWISLIPVWMIFSGCATIPKNASYVSQKVSEGIQRMEQENEKVILALGETQKAILDEKWDDIYATVEKKYMDKHKISGEGQLAFEDRKSIAATAAQAREDILKIIQQHENDLLRQSQANARIVIEINDEVIRYLNSLEDVAKVRSRITSLFGSITGVNPEGLRNAVENGVKLKDGSETKK